MTVLVSGATGLVGGDVARLLARQGGSVRALVRDPAKATALSAIGAEVVRGDLGEPASLVRAFEGVERVFVASALDPRQVELQANAVEAARRAGVRHVVKLSGVATALDSSIASGRWHARTEQAIERSGMAWTHLRPLFFFQNLLHAGPTVAGRGVLPNTCGAAAIAGVLTRATSRRARSRQKYPFYETFHIEGDNFTHAGSISSKIKRILKQEGFPNPIIRRMAIATFEAEMNVICYARWGILNLLVSTDFLKVVVDDEGAGIRDVIQAMKEGICTASETDQRAWIRSGNEIIKYQESDR